MLSPLYIEDKAEQGSQAVLQHDVNNHLGRWTGAMDCYTTAWGRVCPLHKDIRWSYSHCWSHLISPSIHHQLAMVSMRLQLKLLIASNSSMLLDHSWHLTLSRETSRNIQGRHSELTWWGEKRRERDGGKGEKRKRKRREEKRERERREERGEEKRRKGREEEEEEKDRDIASVTLTDSAVTQLW